MKIASATDLAIALGNIRGEILVTEKMERSGEPFWTISDPIGVIEVWNTEAEAWNRVKSLKIETTVT